LPKNIAGEGHRSADLGIGGSVEQQTAGAGPKSVCSGNHPQWGAVNCAALLTASAGQYSTSNCKPPLFRFHCKLQYIKCRDL